MGEKNNLGHNIRVHGTARTTPPVTQALDAMIKKEAGSIKIITLKGVPVYLHWSFPAAGLVLYIFAKFAIPETIYYCIAFTFLIILHEIGHATVAHYQGLKVFSIKFSGAGGLCKTESPKSFIAAILFASAGIFIQIVILLSTVLYLRVIGNPNSVFGKCLAITFIYANAAMVILNLIPQKRHRQNYGTDGYLLWKLTSNRIFSRSYVFPDTSATLSPKTQLTQLEGYMPQAFKTGIEILNDNNTTMEFVVSTLKIHMEISQEEAIAIMVDIHTKGGILIPFPSYEKACDVAIAITSDAKSNGYRIICRAVNVQQPL
ncbi:MAG: ATP-dependent Clp protease adaptor ClpS [Nitrospirota bacterium]